MRKIDFKFPSELYTFKEIDSFFEGCSKSIEVRFSKEKNKEYESDFIWLSKQEIDQMQSALNVELSLTASFQTLACIESILRTDFIIRSQLKKKDNGCPDFTLIYNPKNRPYTYSLKEDILDKWKEANPSLKDLINTLIEAYNFRNWYAHGRYWDYQEKVNIHKFNYEAICEIKDIFESNFLPHLFTTTGFGDPSYNWKK